MNDCLILIDKPLNLTSNYVLQSMKKRLKIKKAGLVGILDPLATGMLLIVTGEATKFSQYIETMTKEYVVTIKFGYKSSTGDGEGIITKEAVRTYLILLEIILSKLYHLFLVNLINYPLCIVLLNIMVKNYINMHEMA